MLDDGAVLMQTIEKIGTGARTRHRARRHARRTVRGERLLGSLGLIIVVTLWALVVRWGDYQPFILPSPRAVADRFVVAVQNGTLLYHTLVTLREVVSGMALGLTFAFTLGYALAKSPTLERVISPYLVASQAVPTVALAPLLIIWFGNGALSKVLVCAVTVFFPVLINTIVGIRGVDTHLVDVMRSFRANGWQTFTMLELPAALPVLLGGLKVGVTLSVIGAVVGEFVGSDRGLGFLVNLARGLFDTPLMFVAIVTLMVIALALYLLVSALEKWLLRWHMPEEKS